MEYRGWEVLQTDRGRWYGERKRRALGALSEPSLEALTRAIDEQEREPEEAEGDGEDWFPRVQLVRRLMQMDARVLGLECRVQRTEQALDLPGPDGQVWTPGGDGVIGFVTCLLMDLVHQEAGHRIPERAAGLQNRCNEVARGIVQNVRNHYERLQQK